MKILSSSSLLLIPPNYQALSDQVVQHMKGLIETNQLAIVFFRGIIKKASLVERLGFLNDSYVDWGVGKTFQLNYNLLLQQSMLTKSLHFHHLLNKYGKEMQEFCEKFCVKPEEVASIALNNNDSKLETETPPKIAINSYYCTGLKPQKLCQPNDWICFATNYTNQELRYSILVHKEKKVLFSHWYAFEGECKDFSFDLVHSFVQYILFEHKCVKELLKEKLKVRIVEDFKLSDIDVITI
ncbi:hypothetical protein ABK040_008718 [Willaertia magna]